MMLRIRGLMLAAVLVCLGACGPSGPPLPPGVVDTPALGGNWIIINYWAIWCAPCREEIPELNNLARSSSELDVYAINFDDVAGDALLEQAAELGIDFPLLARDPGPALGAARPTVLPTTLVVSPSGEVVTRLIGPQTKAALLQELAYAKKNFQQQ